MAARRKTSQEPLLKFQLGTYTASFVKLPEMAYWEIYSPQKKIVAFAASKKDAQKKMETFERGEEVQMPPREAGFTRNFR
jgi:hypothetical protein